MTRFPAAAVVTLLAVVTAGAADQQTLRLTSHGVRLVVIVTEGGRPARGLAAADFQVTDNSVGQKVDSARVMGAVTAVLALDRSLSVRMPGFAAITGAADTLLSHLQNGDRIGLVTFADRVSVVDRSTLDVGLVRRHLEDAVGHPWGVVPRSVVWDAVFAAAAEADNDTTTPIVVLVSDGMDNASWLEREELARTLARVGVIVDLVSVPWNKGSDDFFEAGRQAPEDLAAKTGGIVYSATDANLGRKLEERLSELRSAYVLTFQPSGVKNGDGWHDLKVRVPSRRVSIRARQGYFSAR